MMTLTAETLIDLLDLHPHPEEGGWFSEIYRSGEAVGSPLLSQRYGGERMAGTAIYYLLTPDTFSAMHRLKSDEIFHFYLGDPVEQLVLLPDGGHEVRTLGADLAAGARPVSIIPRDAWQGARLKPGGRFALLGCTVAPGFEYEDYEHGAGPALAATYPEAKEIILALST